MENLTTYGNIKQNIVAVNMVTVYEKDLNNLENENKELKNRIIELKKDITFLRTLIFKQIKTEENLRNKKNLK